MPDLQLRRDVDETLEAVRRELAPRIVSHLKATLGDDWLPQLNASQLERGNDIIESETALLRDRRVALKLIVYNRDVADGIFTNRSRAQEAGNVLMRIAAAFAHTGPEPDHAQKSLTATTKLFSYLADRPALSTWPTPTNRNGKPPVSQPGTPAVSDPLPPASPVSLPSLESEPVPAPVEAPDPRAARFGEPGLPNYETHRGAGENRDTPEHQELVTGRVVRISSDEVLVAIDGPDSGEGVIPRAEVSRRGYLHPSEVLSLNQRIEAVVLVPADSDGRLIMSLARASSQPLQARTPPPQPPYEPVLVTPAAPTREPLTPLAATASSPPDVAVPSPSASRAVPRRSRRARWIVASVLIALWVLGTAIEEDLPFAGDTAAGAGEPAPLQDARGVNVTNALRKVIAKRARDPETGQKLSALAGSASLTPERVRVRLADESASGFDGLEIACGDVALEHAAPVRVCAAHRAPKTYAWWTLERRPDARDTRSQRRYCDGDWAWDACPERHLFRDPNSGEIRLPH